MTKFRIKYFYLASGMEGIPIEKDFGIVEANSEDEAKNIVALREVPDDTMYGPNNAWSTRDFFQGCLTAKPMPPDEAVPARPEQLPLPPRSE